MQVLPTQLIPDEKEGKVLRVRMIQKEGVKFFDPTYLFDEGSTISWIPCGRKLTCSFPGIKFYYGPDTYYGEEVLLSDEPMPIKSIQCYLVLGSSWAFWFTTSINQPLNCCSVQLCFECRSIAPP